MDGPLVAGCRIRRQGRRHQRRALRQPAQVDQRAALDPGADGLHLAVVGRAPGLGQRPAQGHHLGVRALRVQQQQQPFPPGQGAGRGRAGCQGRVAFGHVGQLAEGIVAGAAAVVRVGQPAGHPGHALGVAGRPVPRQRVLQRGDRRIVASGPVPGHPLLLGDRRHLGGPAGHLEPGGRGGVELRGGGVGHPLLGLVPGQLQVAGRRAVLAALREVERQRFGRRARLVLQRLADAAVQPPPPGGRQAVLDRLPDQVVGEPVPVRPVLGQQPGLQRRLHRLQHLLVVTAGDLGQQRVRHDPARHRGDR